MRAQTTLSSLSYRFAPAATIACPAQVLVIDRPNGPASILIDTISLLLDNAVSVTTVEDHDDALRALDYYDFGLIVVGVDQWRPMQIALLPHLATRAAGRLIVVVSRDMLPGTLQRTRRFGAQDVIFLPDRAADLQALLARLTERYLCVA